jgi:hypothetical protein
MELVLLAFLFLVCSTLYREGFDPYHPDTKPPYLPDQSYSGHLVLAEKHIQDLLNKTSSKTPYLEDLLLLLQSIG